MAAKLAMEESKKIFQWSDRYLPVLRAVAAGAVTWSRIYERTSISLGPISKSNLTYLLDNLVRYGYLERREDGSFTIQDPVVEYMVAHL